MAQVISSDKKSPQVLLHLLCAKLTGLKDDNLTPFFRIASSTLSSSIASQGENDEFEIADNIKRKLARHGREREAAIFSELHRKLQGQDLIKDRAAILLLLNELSENKTSKRIAQTPNFVRGLLGHATSTPFVGQTPAPPALLRPPPHSTVLHSGASGTSTGTSGISSIQGSLSTNDPSPIPQSYAPSYAHTPGVSHYNTQGGLHSMAAPGIGLKLLQAIDRRHNTNESSVQVVRDQRSLSTTRSRKDNKENTSFELPESVILREVVYALQGIEGKYIKIEGRREGFKVDPKIGIPKATRQLVSKLAECGWLYNKVWKYADARSSDRAFGLVGQSFCAALHQQLADYYRLIAVLDAQLQQEEDLGINVGSEGLTLRRLSVWINDPMVRLKALAALVDVCQGKKGGGLASAIHSYIQHGDPMIRALVKHSLTMVAQPIFSTILLWIYDGELEDMYHEFFVASDPTVKDDRLWHDKYSLRKSMIPSFISMEQAKKILLSGKSINFLRQVCHDRTTLRGRDLVKAAETHQVESIFAPDLDGQFQKMIDTVYKETSGHLLEVLHNKYKFMDHLKAMRRYLLLGQGDFIRHLMDLLEEDLAKPAASLFLHNLTGILDTAIRATNAQYDDTDILKRLDVRLLELSPGDAGWDVFSLDYHVDGPIRTVFTPECMITYLRVFNFLWRAKRMEYILSGIWRGQMADIKILRTIPELAPVLHQCHLIASEMVHFVQQVQYYINFEVLECSWDELVKEVKGGRDLDHIIAAHQKFLDTIVNRSLLDEKSSEILTQLRTIFDLIIKFQGIQDAMYESASEELQSRQTYEQNVKRNTQKGKWGVTQEEEEKEQQRRSEFKQTVNPTRSQVRLLQQSYQKMVQQFLVMLTSHSDVSLRFLSFRLDFNENYRSKDPKLRTSLYAKSKTRTSVN